jgi:uncharacterized protein (UPF0335 family)
VSRVAPSADGSVSFSDNEPVDLSKPAEIEKVIRVAKAEYNTAASIKREAAGTMRDVKRDFQKSNAAVYEEIDAIMSAARDRLKGKLRSLPDYQQAEDDKRDASQRMKAVVKLLKDRGIDVAAFKYALKLADMDQVEREEHFDNVDIYAKVLRCW